jgi:hypothetical protein
MCRELVKWESGLFSWLLCLLNQAFAPDQKRTEWCFQDTSAIAANSPEARRILWQGVEPVHGQPAERDWCQSLMPPCGTRNDESWVEFWWFMEDNWPLTPAGKQASDAALSFPSGLVPKRQI